MTTLASGARHHATAMQETSELALVERAVAGDERAFAELVTRYQTAVYNLAYRMLGDAGEAEDAAQEVFLRIYRRLATYDADHRFSTWVLSIASHYCIDLLRRKRPWLVPLENISNWMRARIARAGGGARSRRSSRTPCGACSRNCRSIIASCSAPRTGTISATRRSPRSWICR